MATDYEKIAAKNLKRYGTAIDEYGPLLLAERYSDHTHFVYELLQNAEDALGWRMSQESGFTKGVKFSLDSKSLVFSHYGLPFREEDVSAICQIGKGPKEQDLTAIGEHGIGFKSVYAYTQHPEVHSGDEHFVINLFVQPRGIKSKQTELGETLFFLPLDHAEIPKDKAYGEIANRLKKLGLKTLLFLRNIESISWKLMSGETGTYLRDSKQLEKGIDQITLMGEISGQKESREEWLVFSKPVKNNGSEAGFVEIAFALNTDSKTSKPLIVRAPESPLAVFFPTEKETHFGFLIQGPYRTTPSRDNIPKDEPWNQYLVSETADFLVNSLRKVRELGFMTVSALEALVVDSTKYQSDLHTGMFRPICDAILAAFRTERLIPQFGGGYVAANNGRLARAENLRKLLSPKQLQYFADSTEEIGWIDGDITRNLTPTLFPFLVNQVGVKEIESEDFVREVSTDFLNQQSDDWMAKFYTFLLEQPYLRNKPWFPEKEIIRLENNSHVKPFDSRGIPNAYLPGDMATDFPTVKKTICQHAKAMEFLKTLGLKVPDPVDDVIQNVLPRYKEESNVTPPEYAQDIQRIIEANKTDSTSRRTELMHYLREAAWVRCRNAANGDILLKTPGSVYLPTKKLQQLFDGISEIWFVDREVPFLQGRQIQEVLEAASVSEYLKKVKIDCDLSGQELRQIRVNAGLDRCSWGAILEDYSIEGLPEVLKRISASDNEIRYKLAFVLWECLHDVLQEHREREGFFKGKYQWSYSHEYKTEYFPAKFVRLLRETAWLPGIDGSFKKPSQICFEELPQQFRDIASPILIKLLEFKPDEVKQLAEKTGISEEILDMIREHGVSAEQIKALIEESKKGKEVTSESEDNGWEPEHSPTEVPIHKEEIVPVEIPKPNLENQPTPTISSASDENDNENEKDAKLSRSRSSQKIGRWGEEYVFHALKEEYCKRGILEETESGFKVSIDNNGFVEVVWLNKNGGVGKGYDFVIKDNNTEIEYIEVKTKTTDEPELVEITGTQWEFARKLYDQNEGEKYWIYVVSNAGNANVKYQPIQNPINLWKEGRLYAHPIHFKV